MQLINRQSATRPGLWLILSLMCFCPAAMALESDRQQPLEVNAIGLDLNLKTNTFNLKQQVKATYAVN